MQNLRIPEDKLPTHYGFSMPAEWEPHSATLLSWPVREEWDCPSEDVMKDYAALVGAILSFNEKIILVVRNQSIQEAQNYLGRHFERIQIVFEDQDDSWIRDNGPIVLKGIKDKRAEIVATKWRFNAWGEKFNYSKDNKIPYKIFDNLNMPYFEKDIVLEGGSINVDGEGTLLTTNQCLDEQKRNPAHSSSEIDEILMKNLGVSKVIRLNKGLAGDHTDGHVDNVACFLKPGVVLIQLPSDKNDPNYEAMRENYEILLNATDAKGRKLDIITIQPPKAIFYGGNEYTASYVNLYFINGGVFVPIFGGENKATDDEVLRLLREFYQNERKVIAVKGDVFVRGGGNIHCLTQQIPEGEPSGEMLSLAEGRAL